MDVSFNIGNNFGAIGAGVRRGDHGWQNRIMAIGLGSLKKVLTAFLYMVLAGCEYTEII